MLRYAQLRMLARCPLLFIHAFITDGAGGAGVPDDPAPEPGAPLPGTVPSGLLPDPVAAGNGGSLVGYAAGPTVGRGRPVLTAATVPTSANATMIATIAPSLTDQCRRRPRGCVSST